MKSCTRMKILIVDDSLHVHHQIKAFFNSGGYHNLVFAHSVAEAFEFLGLMAGNVIGAEIDLILMNIQMGDVDGIEAARTIKARREYKHIPVIMMTGEDVEEILERAFNAGAVDYITKPLRKIELLARVASSLRFRQETIRRKEREQDLINLTAELRKVNSKLSRLAESDGLTGVPNRRFFDQMFEREWLRAARSSNCLALMMIDIDHFKFYNDKYGHQQGDQCLKIISKTMNDVLLRPGDFLARYGGEEFAVVLPETAINGAIFIAEELAASIAPLAIPHASSPVASIVTISMGIAVVSPDEGNQTSDELICMADQALYQAKEKGRNRWCVFQDENGGVM